MQNPALTPSTKPSSLTDWARLWSKAWLDPLAVWANRIGMTPDWITVAGFLGHVGASILAAYGYFTWAGVLIGLTAPLDALDGALARLQGSSSKWGAFLDSTLDRFSEAVLLLGVLIYFAQRAQTLVVVAVFAAFVGAILVSYTRARAEALGFDCKVGWFSRLERYLVLTPALLFQIPQIGMYILAIFANFTAMQRMHHVWRQAQNQKSLS
jgi:CDP-diacylglycerol--glycerol-3-phosphate 3-phosphatidyltransferase